MFDSYDKTYLVSRLLVVLAIVAVMYFTNGIGFALVIPLLLFAFVTRNEEDLLFYLILTGTMVVGNSNIMPKTAVFFVLQRGVMLFLALALSVRVFGLRTSPVLRALLPLCFYLVFMFFSSSVGWCPWVSYLKLLLFGLCFFAYYGITSCLVSSVRVDVRKVRSILLVFAIFYILGSVALVPFPDISQLRGEEYVDLIRSGAYVTSLFTGMTNQSQCLGPIVAALTCLLLGDLVFGIKRFDKLYLALLLFAPYLIYKTSSRTALGTFLAGILCVLFFFARAHGVGSRWRSKVMVSFICLGALGAGILLALPKVRQGAMNFAMKWGGDHVRVSELTIENIYATRQGKIDEALYYFKRSPIIGNGFQVSEEMQGLGRSGFRTVLSAPVEKGVWIFAILEEGGVIGMSLFILFVIGAVRGMVRKRAYIGASLFITFLVSNMGEFSFFSMSYIGGFMWAMLSLGLILDLLIVRVRVDVISS